MISPKTGRGLLALILVLRCIVSIVLFDALGGYAFITADDVTRTDIALSVSRDFEFLPHISWPPLQFWLVGLALHFHPEPLSVNALIGTAAAVATLVLLYSLCLSLAPGRPAGAVLCVAAAAFHPWLVRYSLSAQTYYLFHLCVVGGIAFALRSLGGGSTRSLFAAAVFFLLGSMVRFEGFFFAAAFSALLIFDCARRFRSTGRVPGSLPAAALLPWAFLPIYLIGEHFTFGDAFAFLKVSRQDFSGLGSNSALAFSERLLRYPRAFWTSGDLYWPPPPVLVVLAALGLAGRGPTLRACAALVFGAFGLLLVSSVLGTGSEMAAGPLSVFLLLLLPFAARPVARLAESGLKRVGPVLFVAAIGLVVRENMAHSFTYRWQAGSDETLEVGRIIQKRAGESGRILVEERLEAPERDAEVWDGYILYIFAPDHVIFDRKRDFYQKNGRWVLRTEENPSVFEKSDPELREFLAREKVTMVVTLTERARARLEPIARSRMRVGMYEVFLFGG